MDVKMSLTERFNDFIATGIIDDNEFQEYEACIVYFDNQLNPKSVLKKNKGDEE